MPPDHIGKKRERCLDLNKTVKSLNFGLIVDKGSSDCTVIKLRTGSR